MQWTAGNRAGGDILRGSARLPARTQPRKNPISELFASVFGGRRPPQAAAAAPPLGKPFAPQRRLAVGAQPRALLVGDFVHGSDLAVANAGSGSLTFIHTGNDAAVPATVAVGGAPVSLSSVGGVSDNDVGVGDASAPRITLWRSTTRGLALAGTVALPNPSARARLLGAVYDGDGAEELVIGDPMTGTVAVAPRWAGRRFGPPVTLQARIEPVQLVAGGDMRATGTTTSR